MRYIQSMVRKVRPEDSEAICSIYNYYITNTHSTFEETPVSAEEMEKRIRTISGKYPYLVLEEDGGIKGYIYINTWKDRSSYRYSAEISVYVKNGYRGEKLGSRLMEALLAEIRKTDLHAILAGIVLPNDESVAFHEKFGFRKTGQLEEVGFKFNKWMSVGYWELILN